ncbi:F-box/kelch-repeat protein At3g23880-like [Neltuma alba]|uniref:F-box/kelch-repeat protein At3g23880-like n=1 Tax=Neltuma alba TaxID=207710 RepID=UPI0010A32555|nr:F-box/kelch-repeat protein At3g23880-like [Prosopis alba]
MEKLAEDLRMEILLRLPDFKSILRCKCLSKSWYSLISSPKFTDLHFQRSSSQHAHRFLYTNPPERIRSIDINASFNDHSATIELDFPLIKPYTDINIITSCRGFLLLMLVKDQLLFLWNPTTGLHKQISNPPLPWVPTISYGFCYDESVDDYLVVAFNFNDPSWLESFVIFSLRTNSWQKLTISDSYQLPKITIPFPVKSGSFLNGSIHWLISCCDPPQVEAKIIALDITTKDLREIPGPPDDDDNCMNYDLGVLGGFLTITSYYKTTPWVKLRYGG